MSTLNPGCIELELGLGFDNLVKFKDKLGLSCARSAVAEAESVVSFYTSLCLLKQHGQRLWWHFGVLETRRPYQPAYALKYLRTLCSDIRISYDH